MMLRWLGSRIYNLPAVSCRRLMHGNIHIHQEASNPVILVQPRHRADIDEAVSLLEAFKGPPDAVTIVGRSRMTRPGPCYFGLGAIQAIRAEAMALEARQTPRPSALPNRSGGRHPGVVVPPAVGGSADMEGSSKLHESPSDSHDRSSMEEGMIGNIGARLGGIREDQESDRPPPFRHNDSVSRIVVNAILSPMQERNLSSALGGREVIDRVGVILGIFAQRAQTREARLQVDLASLMHQKSRLVRGGARRAAFEAALAGRAGVQLEVVSARQRGRSGSGSLGGGGGSGDSELQMQRYRILRRIKAIRRDLQAVRATRGLHRGGRKAAGAPQVAVVGYTNVGKSSLVSALSGSQLLCKDALFVTLDPAARRLVLPSGDACVLSDTVGFISDLPVELVEAFKSTLEEVVESDLIIHVLDASSPNVEKQRTTVIDLLLQLGVSQSRLQHKTIEVWNKCDLIRAASHGASLMSAISSSAETSSLQGPDDDAYPSGDFAYNQAGNASIIGRSDTLSSLNRSNNDHSIVWRRRWRRCGGILAHRNQKLSVHRLWMPMASPHDWSPAATRSAESRSTSWTRQPSGSEVEKDLSSLFKDSPSSVPTGDRDGHLNGTRQSHSQRLDRRNKLFSEPSTNLHADMMDKQQGKRTFHHLMTLEPSAEGCRQSVLDVRGRAKARQWRSPQGRTSRGVPGRRPMSSHPLGREITAENEIDSSLASDEEDEDTGPNGSILTERGHLEQHYEEEQHADLILERVSALVSGVHRRCGHQVRPAVVASSAILGWGRATLLRLLEAKLTEFSLLRGRA